MPTKTYGKTRGTGTDVALVYEDGYANWAWWCPRCTPREPDPVIVGQEGFKTRDGARRSAINHERGHW